MKTLEGYFSSRERLKLLPFLLPNITSYTSGLTMPLGPKVLLTRSPIAMAPTNDD
jgi:hypothetical protein